jgi:hypothetical protein
VNARLLADGVSTAQVTMMEQSRHFPMSDQPQQFVQALYGFLSGNGHY